MMNLRLNLHPEKARLPLQGTGLLNIRTVLINLLLPTDAYAPG